MKHKTMFVPGESSTSFADVTDGTSSTILILKVNSDAAVPWTKPDADWKFDPDNPKRDLFGDRRGLTVAFADSSVHNIAKDTSPENFKAMLTRDAGDIANVR